MKNIKVNPDYNLQRIPIPGTPLHAIVVDEFLFNTDTVTHFAHNIAYFNPMFSDNTLFPGMRDKMPMPYTRLLKCFFEKIILPKIKTQSSYQSNFHSSLLSLVTCPPSELAINQKMPHVDSCNNDDYAFVHYFSAQSLGGTSFYCYKPKQLIEFKQEHKPVLPEMITQVTNSPNDHLSYITASTSLFDQILTIEAKFNRLVIYPANVLHSANLTSPNSYCGDINRGRLSISSFASITNR
ncbi:DUF6445 family protein [Colwellia psychrerythraea]|nr:DUF6445 family protein [Colwellia psychrerythraea]